MIKELTESPPPAAVAQSSRLPVLDLAPQFRQIREEVTDALIEVANSTCYVLGPKVAEFENAFADYVGCRHCVCVNSGTSALHLSLIAAGVGQGDEVITVPMTFVATAWAINYVGARPVFVDVDPVTYTMDIAQVEASISHRTKAILPVHLYGQAVDLEPLMEIASQYGIPIIEDAAQAHGASYRGRRVGAFGLCGCFSFYPGKNLGALGEAGAIVTDDDKIAHRLRSLRDHAQTQRYYHDEIGFNYRMDAFQGAVLNVKLRYLDHWTEKRRTLARRYKDLLGDLPLQLPVEAADRDHVWHLFVVLHPERDRIRQELEERGVLTALHYPVPVHLQKAYRYLHYAQGDFPVAERIATECMTLPLYAEMSIAQQDRVVDALSEILKPEY